MTRRIIFAFDRREIESLEHQDTLDNLMQRHSNDYICSGGEPMREGLYYTEDSIVYWHGNGRIECADGTMTRVHPTVTESTYTRAGESAHDILTYLRRKIDAIKQEQKFVKKILKHNHKKSS